MSDHNDLDDALRQRMHAGIREGGDAHHELTTMRPRFERARRRRATVTAAASTAAVAIVVVGALSLGGGPRDERVQVADSSVAPRSTLTSGSGRAQSTSPVETAAYSCETSLNGTCTMRVPVAASSCAAPRCTPMRAITSRGLMGLVT